VGTKKIKIVIFETSMPLVFKDKVLSSSTLAVWKIEEDESFFINNCHDNWDREELKKLKGARRLEWIASRFLIQRMTKKTFGIKKDKFGKPQLNPHDFQISISHSHTYVAVIISSKIVGIDIQKRIEGIERIAHKFLNEPEKSFAYNRFKISNLHVIWGAKESLFKAYGRKKVDFKRDLWISKFTYRKKGKFQARIEKKNYKSSFSFENKFFNNLHLVYGEQD